MPLLFGLSVIIQLALVVHIIKTGRDRTWIWVVMFAPLIGSLAYGIVELLPEFRRSRTAQTALRNIQNRLYPEKALNEAVQRFRVSATVRNAMDVAEHFLELDRYEEARDVYLASLKGIHANDPDLLLGLAKAQMGLREYAATVETLERLKRENPEKTGAAGHLLYARALELQGNVDSAMVEYDALCAYDNGAEQRYRLALLYRSKGNELKASHLFHEVVEYAQTAGPYFTQIQAEWIEGSKRELKDRI